ncbi:hypothetical protein BH09BAC1_BH09BAC1_14230 [soil metagenome]
MILIFVYESLIAQLNVQTPEVVHIDMWDNQPIQEAQNHPYNLPAVFIEFADIVWEQRGQRMREANLDLRVHLQTNVVGLDTDSNTDYAKRVTALERLTLLDGISKALIGYQAYQGEMQFGKILQTGTALNSNSTQSATDVLTFRCRVYDPVAVPVQAVGTVKGVGIEGSII